MWILNPYEHTYVATYIAYIGDKDMELSYKKNRTKKKYTNKYTFTYTKQMSVFIHKQKLILWYDL